MRRGIVIGLLLCVLEQANGNDDGYDDIPTSCTNELLPHLNAMAQADACGSYTDDDDGQLCTTDPSDPEYCTPIVNVASDSVECKKFTSAASQFCTTMGMEARRNVTGEVLYRDPETEERATIFDVIQAMPQLYSSEGCRSIVRDLLQASPAEALLVTEAVNKMCSAKAESSDNTDLAIGLGVGLGVGLPLICGIIYVLVRRSKAPKATESLEPFLSY